jgi:MYXO-CTERM domain-containing protein
MGTGKNVQDEGETRSCSSVPAPRQRSALGAMFALVLVLVRRRSQPERGSGPGDER